MILANRSEAAQVSPGVSRNMLTATIISTLLVDLLTSTEESLDQQTAGLRFDIGLFARRVVGSSAWIGRTKSPRPGPLRGGGPLASQKKTFLCCDRSQGIRGIQ